MTEYSAKKKIRLLRVVNFILIGVVVGFTISAFLFNPFNSGSAEALANAQLTASQTAESQRNIPIYEPVSQTIRGSESLEFAQRLEYSFNQVVEQVLPSVVELRVTERITQRLPQTFDFFPWFFGTPRDRQEDREFEANSLGSGFIFMHDPEEDTYYVMTNNHVAGKADSISVVLNDGTIYDNAELIGANARRDLAVVAFSSEAEYPLVNFGDSDSLKVGDWVLAMGSPYGYISSVTAGIVSALGRSGRDVDNISDFIQTDASINQGNSGGPLVNIHGEVVGINTWIAAPTGGNIGLGFSIPINNAKRVVNDLLLFGDVQDGWLGVSMVDTGSLPAGFPNKYKEQTGVFITNVYLDSPAYKSGLRPGDIVVRFNTVQVRAGEVLSREIGNASVSDTHEMEVIRAGKRKTVSVDLEVRKPDAEIRAMSSQLWPAVMPMPLTDEIRRDLRLSDSAEGVMVYFSGDASGTKLYSAGIRNLDIITSINNTPVRTVEDFYRLINDEDARELSIRFLREGNEFFVGVVR